MYNEFTREVKALRSKGRKLRQLNHLYKAAGLAVAALGGAAVVSTAGGLVPLLVGLATWGGAVLQGRSKTGRLCPFPFSDDDLDGMAQQAVEGSRGLRLELQPTDFLGLDDKALLYLLQDKGEPLTAIAYVLDEEQFDYILDRMIDRLTLYGLSLNHLAILEAAQVEQGDLQPGHYFNEALHALPPEITQEIESKLTEQVAVSSQLEPEARPATSSTQNPIEGFPSAPYAAATVTPSNGETTQLGEIEAEVEAVPSKSPEDRLRSLLGLPLVILAAVSGSGKTTTIQWLAAEAAKLGYRVVIADPHYEYGTYANLPVFGKNDYAECNELVNTILDIVDQRYEERMTVPKERRDTTPYLFILDEFTHWHSQVDRTEDLMRRGISDFRKVFVQVVVATHGLTKTQIGCPAGFYDTLIGSATTLKLHGKHVTFGGRTTTVAKGTADLVELGEDKGMIQLPDLSNWTMPEQLPACDFRLNGRMTSPSTPSDGVPSDNPSPVFEVIPFTDTRPTYWEKQRQKFETPTLQPLADLMLWIEGKGEQGVSKKDIQNYSRLRTKFDAFNLPGSSSTEKIERALETFKKQRFIELTPDGNYKVSHRALQPVKTP